MTSHTVPQNRHKFRQKIDTSPSTKFQYKDMGVLVRSNDPYVSICSRRRMRLATTGRD